MIVWQATLINHYYCVKSKINSRLQYSSCCIAVRTLHSALNL